MELVDVEQQHITTLMSWIDDEAALYQWGGLAFAIPMMNKVLVTIYS